MNVKRFLCSKKCSVLSVLNEDIFITSPVRVQKLALQLAKSLLIHVIDMMMNFAAPLIGLQASLLI